MAVFRRSSDLSGWGDEDRRPGKTGESQGGADSGGRSPFDLHRRRDRLRHGLSFHHREARIWTESVYRKYVKI